MNASPRRGLPALACITGLAICIAAGQFLQAEQPTAPTADAYHYVGVQQTIARVHVQTGEIDILARGRDTRSSLLIPDSRPWTWRPVRINSTEPNRRRPTTETGETEHPTSGPVRPRP